MTPMKRGLLYGILAYLLWGLLPVFWKQLQIIPSHLILLHRMIWSLGFVIIIIIIRKNWSWINKIMRNPDTYWIFIVSALILTLNWGTYIWAVNHEHIVESSLGYFINPIVNVLLGVLVLKERLRIWQWIAAGFAFVGILYITFHFGRLPWIALILAFSFAFYGLLRKTATLGSIEGLSLETVILFIPAVILLIYLDGKETIPFFKQPLNIKGLLILTGPATALPLLLFAAAARRIQFSTVGLLQYIAPSLQFLIGIFIYGEDLSKSRLIGFFCIWTALILYSLDGWMYNRKNKIKQI